MNQQTQNYRVTHFQVLGLTGGIASGKSTAARMFAAKGVKIIDADKILVQLAAASSSSTKQQITEHFDSQITDNSGKIEISALNSIIFKNLDQLRWLEKLLHPEITEEITKQTLDAKKAFAKSKDKNLPYCVLTSSLLFDTEQFSLCSLIVNIDLEMETQIGRLKKQMSLNTKDAKDILAKQLSKSESWSRADYILNNDGSLAELNSQLDKIHMQILQLANASTKIKFDTTKTPIRYRYMKDGDLDVNHTFVYEYLYTPILVALGHKYNFIYDKENPDMIILNAYGGRTAVYQEVIRIRKRYGNKPFIILMHGEPKGAAAGLTDYSYSYQKDSKDNTYAPHYVLPAFEMSLFDELVSKVSGDPAPRVMKFHNTPKDRFCAIVDSRAPLLMPFTRKRAEFISKLTNYKKVDCGGSYLNNTDELKSKYKDDKRKFMSRYKFYIAFENIRRPFYISGKIYECFLTGVIPIYYGSPNVTKFYNPKAFINCADFSSFDEVIEKVKQIDNDEALRQSYLAQSPFAENSPLCEMTNEKMVAKWDELIRTKVLAARPSRASISNIHLLRLRNFDLEIKSFIAPIIRRLIMRDWS